MFSSRAVTFSVAITVALIISTVVVAQIDITPLPEKTSTEITTLSNDPVNTMIAQQWGNPEAGEVKAVTCVACHGIDGNNDNPMYPRLAGMPERYIAEQLALFKNGQHNISATTALMTPFVKLLSPQDMRDLGAHFALQKGGAGIADDSEITTGINKGLKFYEIGERLFRYGDDARNIPACMACHGPSGAGNPGPAYPRIAGQHSDYLIRRLEKYRDGVTQEGTPHKFNMMATITKSLSDEEIRSLASYLQGLHKRAAFFPVAESSAQVTP